MVNPFTDEQKKLLTITGFTVLNNYRAVKRVGRNNEVEVAPSYDKDTPNNFEVDISFASVSYSGGDRSVSFEVSSLTDIPLLINTLYIR